MPDEPGGGADGAALTDDDRPALRLDVPQIGERERHQLARVQAVVGLLEFAADAIEQLVDDQAMNAGLRARSDIRVADSGERWHRRHTGVAEPCSFPPQPRERWQHVGVGIEVVRSSAIENEHRQHARPCLRLRERLAQRLVDSRCRRNRAEQRRERRYHALLCHESVRHSLLDEWRSVEEQRDVGVVFPRRAVHERIQRVALDDEVSLARDEEELTAAAGESIRGRTDRAMLAGLPAPAASNSLDWSSRRTSRGRRRRSD